MRVKCLDIEYQEGSFVLVQGVKKGEPDSYGSGSHFQARGHGWGQHTSKSDIVLTVEADVLPSRIANIFLGDFFKSKWARLTKDRQNAIINSMPKFINLKQEEYNSGEIYYVCDSADLELWFQGAEADIVRMKKNRKNMQQEIAANQVRKARGKMERAEEMAMRQLPLPFCDE